MGKISKAQMGSGTVDLPFLGLALARSPQMLQEFIVSRFADYPLTTLFQGIYPESQAEETLPSNQIKWNVYNLPEKPTYIVSVTGNAVVGSDIEITVTDGWLRAGAKLRAEDGETQVHFSTNGTPAGGEYTKYTARVVGNVEGEPAPSWVFEKGKALNYMTANYEEGSEMGHPMYYGTGDEYRNNMTLHRHDADITGDAITEATIFDTMRTTSDGREKKYRGWLPDFMMSPTTSLLDFHQQACEEDHIYGRSNVDLLTGKVFNVNATNSSKPVLMGDGLIPQLDGAYTQTFDPNDPIAAIRAKARNILTYLSAHWNLQDFLEMVVMGGMGAQAVMNDIMADEMKFQNQQVWMTPDKEGKVIAGLRYAEWITTFGKIKFMPNRTMGNIRKKERMIIYNGVSFPASSFDMYFMPIGLLSNGKTNIRFFAKGKNVGGQMINRTLVFSHIQGVTGYLANRLSKAQAEGLSEYANLVSTGRDAEKFHLLSQKMIIVSNPTEFARLLVYRS